MSGSVDKAKDALREIIAKLQRIDSRRLSPEGEALRNANIKTAQVLLDLMNDAVRKEDGPDLH